jgi:uncharacterized membrane protein (UPF0182 family)
MQDPQVFYNKEDLWSIPGKQVAGSQQTMDPYYTIMKLPGAEKEEFILLSPFTPSMKDNMSAWMAARCDAPNYGKVIVYKFPKQKLVYGPRQIEARIDQDPTISKDLSLWNQQGSQVLRGNLLTVPIGGSFLYVEPLYIQATGGKIPELKRVIVATQTDIGYGSTLREALGDLFGPEVAALAPGGEGAAAEGGPAAGGLGSPGGAPQETGTAEAGAARSRISEAVPARAGEATVQSAAEHLRQYQKLMGEGRAAEAGAELDRLARDLEALSRGAAPAGR